MSSDCTLGLTLTDPTLAVRSAMGASLLPTCLLDIVLVNKVTCLPLRGIAGRGGPGKQTPRHSHSALYSHAFSTVLYWFTKKCVTKKNLHKSCF